MLPWYVSETYVYHRLLEATGYFKPGTKGYGFDVFAAEKKEALEQALPQVDVRMQTCMQAKGKWSFQDFKSLLHMSLWGNQGDSSLFTVQDMSSKGISDVEQSRLIVDDSSLSFLILDRKQVPVIHIFNDNSGMELVSDLALAHYLVSSKPSSTVVLQLKPYPFFVSDATVADVHATIETLRLSSNANQQQVAADLLQYIQDGRIRLQGDGDLNFFLASPKPMWEMPLNVRDSLADVDLVICKGDLMYRKLLGDRTWNTNELFQDIISYFPCSVTALRTCKAPLAIGVDDEASERLSKASPSWMVNGEYGMIQFCLPPILYDLQVSDSLIRINMDEEASIQRMQGMMR
uniref:Sugar phosphate phosphatase n=1 Tax=Guillardia theta (strain CCMP2712) TaxID=905079 RepID=A0A0C3TYH8_GUITC